MHLGVKTPPPGPFAVINLQLLQEEIYWQVVPVVPAVYGSGINSSLPGLQNNDLIECWQNFQNIRKSVSVYYFRNKKT